MEDKGGEGGTHGKSNEWTQGEKVEPKVWDKTVALDKKRNTLCLRLN